MVAMDNRFTEQMVAMDNRFTEQMVAMDNRFTDRMVAMENRLTEQMTTRFDAVDVELDSIDVKLDSIDVKLDLIDIKLLARYAETRSQSCAHNPAHTSYANINPTETRTPRHALTTVSYEILLITCIPLSMQQLAKRSRDSQSHLGLSIL
jgi:hypothetical protein